MHRFDTDTAVVRRPSTGAATGATAQFDASMDRGWWIVRGPNGGYVAAVLLRALTETVGDPARTPRSLTVHYAAPPVEGPVQIETRVERAGRSLSTLSARMTQDGKLLALALAAFSAPRPAPELHHARMPEVAPPESLPSSQDITGAVRLPMHERCDTRWAIGGRPFTGAPDPFVGGWIRLHEGARTPDAFSVTLFCDAFPPSLMSTLPPSVVARGMPTVDLTIHFRTALPLASAKPDDFVLAAFRAREARDGFFEEDGEIWSRDGVLLAQSRQLAVWM
jgi:acyl-CoA thioesterase